MRNSRFEQGRRSLSQTSNPPGSGPQRAMLHQFASDKLPMFRRRRFVGQFHSVRITDRALARLQVEEIDRHRGISPEGISRATQIYENSSNGPIPSDLIESRVVFRHARACSRHPRLSCRDAASKAWMGRDEPGQDESGGRPESSLNPHFSNSRRRCSARSARRR
jgi:hypothetical protein